MKTLIKESLILFVIASVAAALLAFAYTITKPIIDENFEIAQMKAMKDVVPSADYFEPVELSEYPLGVSGLNIGYDSSDNVVGYVISAETWGFAGQIDMMIGYDTDFNINKLDILKHKESPGLGALANTDKFKGQFENKSGELSVVKSENAGEFEISAITGSTITTNAVVNGVNNSTDFITNYIGGTN